MKETEQLLGIAGGLGTEGSFQSINNQQEAGAPSPTTTRKWIPSMTAWKWIFPQSSFQVRV